MNRTNVYKSYKKFKDYREKQGKLLKQQVFLSNYIKDNYDSIDKMLLFHGIGTGKTCTSITIAETIMEINKNMKVLVILPARLKTNFIDELISQTCGFNKYISKKDYKYFINPSTSIKDKDTIREKFNKKINVNYQIISYEYLRSILLKSTNYKKTINDITKNRIIIIDEVHNLIASKIKNDTYDKLLKANTINKKITSINAIILRLLTKLAHKTSKIFLLTATPVFDNYGQFLQLVMNLNPDTDPQKRELSYYINQIRGKVSFYKLKDKSDFPSVIIDNIRIQLSKKQINKLYEVRKNKKINSDDFDNDDENISNKFCIHERQISISLLNKDYKDIIFKKLKEYAPKLEVLFKLLKLKGKHVVFSNFIEYCLQLIAEYLKSKGWSNYIESGSITNKTFVIWDASLTDKQKQEVKAIINSKANMKGTIIRVVLGSPSIKEGITFKHIQHLHQIDPVWNSSAKEQVEGRCIRYKSHEDIPLSDKNLKRQVIIHNYIAVADEFNKTCDETIYDVIMVKKKKVISEIERLLGKVSIDYYLWTNTDKSPESHSDSSFIDVTSAERNLKGIINYGKVKTRKQTTSCIKPRRPKNGSCVNPKYPYLYKNKKGDDCCFAKAQTIKTSCPNSRRPINGICMNAKYPYLYKNKNGDDCCFARVKKQ